MVVLTLLALMDYFCGYSRVHKLLCVYINSFCFLSIAQFEIYLGIFSLCDGWLGSFLAISLHSLNLTTLLVVLLLRF